MCIRILDILIASAGFSLTAPLFLLLPLLIKLDSPGRAFFIQRRLGQGGKPFYLLKFRTMQENQQKGRWAVKNDPRTTSVGQILRKSHLDEIPQFLNVIKGDLSIVGPRPYTKAIHEKICQRIPEFALRLRFKPGLTGWAQLVGRTEENTLSHHVYLFTTCDYRYLTSPLTVTAYLQIVVKTIRYFFSEAAYRTF